MSGMAPRYPPNPGEKEYGMVVSAGNTRLANRRIMRRRLRSLLSSGIVPTTTIKVFTRVHTAIGYYFHGFRASWRTR